MDKQFRDSMLSLELLVLSKSRVGCHPAIVELLTREAVSRKEFTTMASVADQIIPVHSQHSYSRDAYSDVRALRNCALRK